MAVGSISPKSLNAGDSPPDPHLDLMNRDCPKTLLPLNIFGWCRWLAILEQNETLLFYIFWSPSLSKNRFSTTEGADIYRCCKQIQHFSKEIEILLATWCTSLWMLSLPDFSAHLTYILILFKV